MAKLLPYDFVISHVGTNNICDRAPFEDIIKDYVSAIIPRPCDYKVSDPMVRAVNSHLNKVMSRKMKVREKQ